VKRLVLTIVAIGICAPTLCAFADTLELKNGSVIKGTFIGGSEAQISFRVGSTVQHYPVADIASLKFDSEGAPTAGENGFAPRPQPNYAAQVPAAAPVSTTQPAPVTTGDRITVPTGTRLTVRTVDAIDSDRNQVGDKFAATLDQPLYVNDLLVIPKGADVYGRLGRLSAAEREPQLEQAWARVLELRCRSQPRVIKCMCPVRLFWSLPWTSR
jgi:hypothetical protein